MYWRQGEVTEVSPAVGRSALEETSRATRGWMVRLELIVRTDHVHGGRLARPYDHERHRRGIHRRVSIGRCRHEDSRGQDHDNHDEASHMCSGADHLDILVRIRRSRMTQNFRRSIGDTGTVTDRNVL